MVEITPPVQTVLAFYEAVERHDWGSASDLWTNDLRDEYPPSEYIVERFAATDRIDVVEIAQVSRSRSSATVAVVLVEHRSEAPLKRTLIGTWDLVRDDGRWLLAEPHF